MNDRLDDELKTLGNEPAPARFALVEAQVWREIESARRARSAAPAILVVRAGAVAGALGLGVVAGGATAVAVAAEVQEISALSVKAELAPSTLLDHHE